MSSALSRQASETSAIGQGVAKRHVLVFAAEEDAAGKALGRLPGVLDRQPRLPDAAETVDHLGVEAAEDGVAALEEFTGGTYGRLWTRACSARAG